MTAITNLPPALWLLAAAVLVPVLTGRGRPLITVVAPVIALVWLVRMEPGVPVTAAFAGFDLILFQMDRLNFVFGVIFLVISAAASIYAWHVRDLGQQLAALLYTAGALGVTFAGDFLTLLLFWELMAISSAWLIFARNRSASTRAGFRYLLMHLAGGSALLAGMVLHYGQTGSLLLEPFLSGAGGAAAWLILIGVAVNVALPPLHAWLPDAYPEATVTGAVYLSALTTKSAVYVMLKLFSGWEVLIYGGVLMTLYGVIYAILANDIRRILAYHIVSQVGFMVTGIGIGTALAMNGTVAHAYSHILYKALLFMAAGAVLEATGRSKLTELGGLNGKLRAVLWLYLIGAFSISGVPLFNGFISKSMIVVAAGEAHSIAAHLLLLLASVGTFLSIALKLPAFAFWGPDRRITVQPVPRNMYVAMGLLAIACVGYGVAPGFLYRMLPFDAVYQPFTAAHLVEAIQLLTFTFVGFWLLRRQLLSEPRITLDTDWFYRRAAAPATRFILIPVNAVFATAANARDALVRSVARRFGNPRAWFDPQRSSTDPFDADRERGPLSASIGFILLLLIALALLMWN
jgi:multicomponent Na+:H+ antiporter subunit D